MLSVHALKTCPGLNLKGLIIWWGAYQDSMLMSRWHDYYWSCLFKSTMKRSSREEEYQIELREKKIALRRFMVPTACAGKEAVVVKRD